MRNLEDTRFVRHVKLERERVPSFEEYPFCLPSVAHLDTLDLHSSVTFIVGENGTGKSTLLEAIAIAWGFNPEGGSRNFNFSSRSSHSSLHEYLMLGKGLRRPRDGYFLRAESFFNVATNIEEMDREADEAGGYGTPVINSFGGRSLHEQSHGESFLTLLTERFGGCGLYILDEPEAALSPSRQLAMLARMHQLVQRESQFIVATHSPIMMAYPDAEILLLTDSGLEPAEYTDTDHYIVAKQFLNDHEGMLRTLLGDS